MTNFDASRLTRLADREHRTGKAFFRKRVFAATTGDPEHAERIFIQFHPNFETIFHRYLAAYAVVPARYIGHPYNIDTHALTIECANLGKQIPSTDNNVRRAVQTLIAINNLHTRRSTYQPPRYFGALLQISPSTMAPDFTLLVNQLCDHPPVVSVGYGVEDPAVSNFVTDGSATYLIDLDNFSDHYHIDSLIGFLLADSHPRTIHSLSPVETIALARQLKGAEVESLPLLCGVIGHIAVTIIDDLAHHPVAPNHAVETLNRFARYARLLLATDS